MRTESGPERANQPAGSHTNEATTHAASNASSQVTGVFINPLEHEDFKSVLLDRITAIDAIWFSKHPGVDHYRRGAFPLEVELFDPEPSANCGNFKMLVKRVNDDTHVKTLLRRELTGWRIVGIGPVLYPHGRVAQLLDALQAEGKSQA